MIDVSYFQNNTSNTQIFQNADTWQTWIKPRNAKMVSLFVIGAGGGGGGGFQTGSGNKSGGTGGGNGGCTKIVLQASIVPDILYILPGTGGTGGLGGNLPTSGSRATKSFICLSPDTGSISNIICTSGATAAIGGPSGSVTAAPASAGETVATSTNAIFLNLGHFQATAGLTGGVGSLTSTANNLFASFQIAAGGGGGSGTGAGFTAATVHYLQSIAVTPQNTAGSPGLVFYKPVFHLFGGRGGGGGSTGGNGGDGAPGCGGGGGGGGTISAGNGGKGGDGFIMITTNF